MVNVPTNKNEDDGCPKNEKKMMGKRLFCTSQILAPFRLSLATGKKKDLFLGRTKQNSYWLNRKVPGAYACIRTCVRMCTRTWGTRSSVRRHVRIVRTHVLYAHTYTTKPFFVFMNFKTKIFFPKFYGQF